MPEHFFEFGQVQSRKDFSARMFRSAASHTGAENFPVKGGRRGSPSLATARSKMQARGFGNDITNTTQERLRAVGKTNKTARSQPVSRPADSVSTHPPSQIMCRLQGVTPVPAPPQAQLLMEPGLGIPPSESLRNLGKWGCEGAQINDVAPYTSQIFASLLREENIFLIEANYMEQQKDINSKMRAILMDWLVEVHMKYRLRPGTLHLTASTIDRFLSKTPVLRKRLQLVGVVAMFISAKFEEIHPPGVNDYEYITDKAYTKQDILSMECQMLTTLNFQIAVPTAAHFMEKLQQLNGCDAAHKEFVNYLTELALLDVGMIRHKPSQLVSASILLSNELLGRTPWPASMREHTQHTYEELRVCVEELRSLRDSAPVHWLQAVCKKYQTAAHHQVANGWPPQL